MPEHKGSQTPKLVKTPEEFMALLKEHYQALLEMSNEEEKEKTLSLS